ncbi:TetR/AcrR family transcriptional regulator [Actinomyces bowdenii]|uniref:TetR/AcrR family transcriptional regulator n=1 Tax=Actinomyces bowdenii TaxID=131109 RepID=A0A853EJW3_9ACTO|nr:TetR/AcrR family transcriptional regulator [Actinomyces bowdenii]MBF0696158.1 TetR/AcrR family transcriptional regulator [Actinomyces bowdenii]NYS68331.1 TetR/AcrR family transcriptional regulator [Actinomyces bowdenii]
MPHKPPEPESQSPTTSSARTAKPAPQRRAEILDTAQRLFITKGVQATSVQDILTEVGIAKGTLYYHFSSKEEILTALIARTTDGVVGRARAIAEGPGTAVDRFLAVLASARVEQPERDLAEQLHAPGNAEFHLLSIVEMVRHLTPVLTGIVEQGNAEGTFDARRPREMIEILLTSAGMLLDEGIFTGEAQEAPRRAAAIVHAAEVLLGCAPGALAPAAPDAEAPEGNPPGARASGQPPTEEVASEEPQP